MVRYLIALSFNFFLKIRNNTSKMQEIFIRLQTIYHSAVWILLIGLQDVRAIATLPWEVFSKSRGILPRIKEK